MIVNAKTGHYEFDISWKELKLLKKLPNLEDFYKNIIPIKDDTKYILLSSFDFPEIVYKGQIISGIAINETEEISYNLSEIGLVEDITTGKIIPKETALLVKSEYHLNVSTDEYSGRGIPQLFSVLSNGHRITSVYGDYDFALNRFIGVFNEA